MTRRSLLVLSGALAALLLALPASASALCNGMAATVGGATSGNDTLTGTSGADVIEGLGGNDTINGLGGADTICGDGDNDTVNGGTGDDHLEGGESGTDVDTVTFAGSNVGSTGVTASLLGGTATVFGSETNTLTGFENLTGSDGFDILTGDNGPNVMDGLDRADGLEGLDGNDTLSDPVGGTGDLDGIVYGNSPGPGGIVADLGAGTVDGTAAGAGTDTVSGVFEIQGSPFDDVLIGDGNQNTFNANGGTDLIQPLGGPDVVNGLFGTDTISYATETGPIVSADLSSGDPGNVTAPGGNDTVFNVEGFIGSPQADDITGGTADEIFDGRGGDDTLNGGSGGSDTASFAGLAQGVDANLATGAALGQGSDTLANLENLTGSDQDDTLTGNAGPNALSGLDGADNITGGLGADGFFLGNGLDVIAADDGVIDTIDCEGSGPDSGSVDGPGPAENYITDCDSDGDGVIDFLDACPTTSATGSDGCVPPVVTTPGQTSPTPVAPTTKKKCKKNKKKRSASVAKKKCKKRKR
jgi:Ca2+-binding RTX toxin-like protein